MISHQHVFSTPVCSLLSPLSAIVLHHPPGINHGLLENPWFKRFLQLQTSIYIWDFPASPVWLPEITTVFVGCQIFRGVLLIDSESPQSTGCNFVGKSQAPAAPDQVPPGGWTQILLYMGWCEVSRGPGDGSRDSRVSVRKKNTQIDGIQDGAPFR